MSPRLPSSTPSSGAAASARPFGIPKRVVAAAAAGILAVSSVLALGRGASADEPTRVPLGERIFRAAAASEVTPVAALPTGSRAFGGVLGHDVAPRFDGRVPARPTPEAPQPAAQDDATAPAPAPPASVWDRLADCESGDWDRNGDPVPGTARWDLRPGEHIFEGGLQFHPDTWDGFAPGVLGAAPPAAYDATRSQQIAVAEAVLDAQGWEAWPVCSRKLGLRG